MKYMKKLREIKLIETIANLRLKRIITIIAGIIGFIVAFFIDDLFPIEKLSWGLKVFRGMIGALI
jgi:uncharacterized membrane protein YeaQ/YmgE (transglycosylase-associated protein family)